MVRTMFHAGVRLDRGGRALVAIAMMASAGCLAALAMLAGPAGAAKPRVPIVLGIHDDAINMCNRSGRQTTAPTAAELAAAASSFSNPHWAALKVRTVRFSPPWDIAYHHDGRASSKANKELVVTQACFNAWLAAAASVGARPEIAFKPDPNFHAPNRHFVGVPSITTYANAITAFVNEYSDPASTGAMARVQIISPWGEPDFPARGNNRIFMPKGGHEFNDPNCHGSSSVATCGPILAGAMWGVVHGVCQQCTLLGQPAGSGVIAGDFSSLGGIRGPEAGYLETYRQHLGGARPLVWGVHPYSDIQGYEKAVVAHRPAPSNTLVAAFARELERVGYHNKTQIWLNEVSAFQGHDMSGHPEPAWTPAVQAAAGQYLLFGLPATAGAVSEPTVTRTYYYTYQASDATNSRWALVLGAGTQPQPIYNTFVGR